MKRLILLLTTIYSLCAHASPPAATVNGVEIPQSAIDAALAHAVQEGAEASSALRNQLRDQLIAEELMWQKAKAAGLDNTLPTREAIERARRQAAIAALVAQHIKPRPPTEQALRARYADIVSRLGKEEFRLSLIQATDEKAVHDAARRIAKGEEFAALARTVSEVPSAARGGELDWVSFKQPAQAGNTNGLPIELASAVSTMQPGQVSAPIALGDSWAIIRLDSRRNTLVPDFDAVRQTLTDAFVAQSIQAQTKDFVVQLMRNASIKVND
ncbi:peptidyl-prolyl cis-trans isomerase [Nitrogeniibacter aestuarii]|uniref:peptidyl-prolyl cis-trans isomerase n=1 Tax=Nitrogeniibacter aestuarii TaxID=2815343 RepID=UPI001D101C5C|nr:peptidyl-prolyl cis-trans isomerase [Nitrogeniibacter aestuarii]